MIYERADSPFLSPLHFSGEAEKKLVYSGRVINIQTQPLLQSPAYQSTSARPKFNELMTPWRHPKQLTSL